MADDSLCSAPTSQDEETCPDPGCRWVEDHFVCVPESMADTEDKVAEHWEDELSPAAEAYVQGVEQADEDERLGVGKSVRDWWRRKSYMEDSQNPRYSDGLPPEWLRLVRSDKKWLAAFQQYLAAAFTGSGEGMLEGAHDWSEKLASMGGEEEAKACGGVKGLAPYQAVSERLAMTAKLDGVRGFLAYHSVGSGKTITSGVCIDAFLGGEDRSAWDLFFVTSRENLAQCMEMLEEIPLVSWRDRWAPLREVVKEERGARVLDGLGLTFSTDASQKKMRARYFAQEYDDFATATNAADFHARMRKQNRLGSKDFGGEGGTTYFHEGNDYKPRIRGAEREPLLDENGHYRPLRGCVIMMDEVQNVLSPVGRDQTELYNSLREEIMREPEVKVILLTATPGDTPAQMCTIMNLLVRPPRYLHEGTGLFPAMCEGGGYAADHPTHFLRVDDYLNPITGQLVGGFERRLQRDMESKNVLVSFVHANEDHGVFAKEVCEARDPNTGRCSGHVVEYLGGEIDVPDDTQSHVHVFAPMTASHKRFVTHTAKGNKRAPVARELGHDNYTYSGYRLSPKTMSISWDAQKAGGCEAKSKDAVSGEDRTAVMPVCDAKGEGLPENRFLATSRKLSTIRWTTGDTGRSYAPPAGLDSLDDVRERVGSKVAALLAVIKRYPQHKHVVICSKFGGDTRKGYKGELGYALHLVMGALGEGVMGHKYHPVVDVEEDGDRVRWSVCGRQACVSRQPHHFALYLTQMPLKMQERVKRLFNDRQDNFGTKDPYLNVLVTNRIEGLSLKTTSFVHLLDAPVSTKNYYQAIGRAVRFCSHTGMPDRSVRVYEYFSVLPQPIAQRYKQCASAEKIIDAAMERVRGKYSVEEARGLAFHVHRPKADGTPLDSLDLVTGALAPRIPDGYMELSGFAGDLVVLNGWHRVVNGTVSFQRPPQKLRAAADEVFGNRTRVFNAAPQLDRLFRALGNKSTGDASTVMRDFRSCSGGVAALQGQLAKAEAAYRIGFTNDKDYAALARKAGLTRRVPCAARLEPTSHNQRVREHLTAQEDRLLDASLEKLEETHSPALPVSSVLTRATLVENDRADESSIVARREREIDINELLHRAESLHGKQQYQGITREFAETFRDMQVELKGGKKGGKKKKRAVSKKKGKKNTASATTASGSASGCFDPNSSAGTTACKTSADCAEGYKCSKGACTTKGGGIEISTDSVLTAFAGVRFNVTRRFVLAIMGAAVDCLLMFNFHTRHPGAMYRDLPGCMD